MSKRLVFFSPITSYFVIILILAGCASGAGRQNVPVKPEEINTAKAQAHDLMSAGNYQGAIDVLSPINAHKSRDPQIDQMLGEAYWGLGDRDDAVSHFENSLRLDYSNWEAHMKLAQVLMEQGKTGRAITEFELAIKFGQNALAYYNYGLSLYEYGRRDEAIAQWEMALKLERSPRNAQALGMGYSGLNDQKALEYFELAAELGADEATFHNNFGLLLTRLGRLQDAETQLRAAVEADSTNGSYRSNLALAYMRAGDYEDAIPQWRRLLKDSTDERVARIYLGQAYYENGRYADAVEVLASWLDAQDAAAAGSRAEPGLDEGFDFLAMSYRGLGRSSKALAYIKRAVELAPRDPIHLNNYGVILAENGRIEDARLQWRKVLDIEPDNAVARQNLSAFDR